MKIFTTEQIKLLLLEHREENPYLSQKEGYPSLAIEFDAWQNGFATCLRGESCVVNQIFYPTETSFSSFKQGFDYAKAIAPV